MLTATWKVQQAWDGVQWEVGPEKEPTRKVFSIPRSACRKQFAHMGLSVLTAPTALMRTERFACAIVVLLLELSLTGRLVD